MNIFAEIEGIQYTPFACRTLKEYNLSNLEDAFKKNATFILNFDKNNKFALSWWVSPKRTRSYPYARVYDSLAFQGKRVTVIPVLKDEGKDGDRDFIQWDTISLMSLLGVYVIISYYKEAQKNLKFENKITNQKFDFEHIKQELRAISSYQSDALHWNITQIEKIREITEKALQSYRRISKKLKVKLHSKKEIEKRIKEVLTEKNSFINYSRDLAEKAQIREIRTIQPKESVEGQKVQITIKNYLGGYYFFTCDEVIIQDDKIYLIECKHSKRSILPSKADIKDGLVKMILYTNLKDLRINNEKFQHRSILKLTTSQNFDIDKVKELNFLKQLHRESRQNNFLVFIKDTDLENLIK
ncbi:MULTISPECIES: hypothetical protein [Thermodesulfovibrio]|uniref:Uncharacterized protein n=1 Tax=Thermodesulfovibrio yellowstonii TaxID=28262 RepID=A0A9W6LL05_9BACT|nr:MULTISPECIES: hypothetical protein [Thermodesulfovibrio]GLI54182.1 hypothetical protein TISLANDTSLP1_18750 [Thermodesulfovibrio islandicus]